MFHAIVRTLRGRRDEGRSRGGGIVRLVVTVFGLALFGPKLVSYFLRVIGVPHWVTMTVMIAGVAAVVGLVVHLYSRIARDLSSHRHALRSAAPHPTGNPAHESGDPLSSARRRSSELGFESLSRNGVARKEQS